MLKIESVGRFAGGFYDRPSSLRLSLSSCTSNLFIPRHKFQRITDETCNRRKSLSKIVVKASEEPMDASRYPMKPKAVSSQYHPFEDITESKPMEGEDAMLTPAESCRTIIEVNSKATVLFSNLVSDEVHENALWPDLPYVTDEYGNIYFQVNDQDILQTLTADDNSVQVIIGMDTAEVLNEIESLREFDIAIEEIDDEDSDFDDDDEDDDDDDDDVEDGSDTEWVSVLEEEDDLEDSDESLGDWAKLETMRSSHPIYFAKKMVDVVSDDLVDYMNLPPAGLAIQGLLKPALLEDYSIIQKYKSESNPKHNDASSNQIGSDAADKLGDLGKINGKVHGQRTSQPRTARDEGSDNDDTLTHGTSFYKLEMTNIQLISVDQTIVEVEDYRKATPDAIAHSAANIISRLKAGGEKTTQALKSLCWRCKGILAEEVSVIGMDTLGFDLRICAGKQLQTLRFTFNTQASSEYSAERQLNDLLFPRDHHSLEKKKATQQTEL